MPTQLTRSRAFVLGTAGVSLVALFLSLGDPGKEERHQLMTSLAESQDNVHLLEEKIGQQDANARQQAELIQQLARKLEQDEEQTARLKARVDELEKTLAKLKQPTPLVKPVAVAPKPVARPVVKPTAPQPAVPAVKK